MRLDLVTLSNNRTCIYLLDTLISTTSLLRHLFVPFVSREACDGPLHSDDEHTQLIVGAISLLFAFGLDRVYLLGSFAHEIGYPLTLILGLGDTSSSEFRI